MFIQTLFYSSLTLFIMSVSCHNVTDIHWTLFQSFVDKHQKRYETFQEFKERFDIFVDNLQFINNENSNNNKYTLGVTKFADLSHYEFSQYLGSFKGFGTGCNSFKSLGDSVNDIDWRTKNVLTPIKNQGECGSCWTFASTETLESHTAIKTGILQELSEQFILGKYIC